MTSSITRTTAALAAATIFTLALAGSAVAASQTWHLLRAETTNSAVDLPLGTESKKVEILDNQRAIFVVGAAAEVAVEFDGGWPYTLVFHQTEAASGPAPSTNTVVVEIGTADSTSGSGFVAALTSPENLAKHTGERAETGIATGTFTVPQGKHLAFAIENAADAHGKKVTVMANHADTRFTSPLSDPGYPTPELTTLLLTLVGLGAVGLFVVSRRK